MRKSIAYNDKIPPIRVLLLKAPDIYYADKVIGVPLEIKNDGVRFDKRFSDLMPLNLDLYYLFEKNKLVLQELNNEFYTYCIINVNFKYPMMVNDKGERVYDYKERNEEMSKTANEIREELYLNGFYLNGKKYVRYKRSASSARSGTCLFIRQDLFNMMDNWSKTGLDETIDKKAFNDLTSYEAYRALSLSSLIKTLHLNPYNILFVKDYEHPLTNQKVVKVTYDKNDHLVASKEENGEVTNNLFDGEGLLDITIFKKCGLDDKGMMLLRNRFFKCCAFNTNLQAWFNKNGIKYVDQLNGFTCAKRIEDIVLVASESCLKYFKMVDGGFSLNNVKRWCDAVSDENHLSRFGIVKTDKDSHFFNGDMVETTYQLINTLQLSYGGGCRPLLQGFIDYINKIKDVKETPEYARLFLHGEINENSVDSFEDDSEDIDYSDAMFDYSWYSFKSKVCFDLIKINSEFVKTDLFKYHIFKDIIRRFRLKIYQGRVLVPGTYATIFGNPLEYLKYIIKKDGAPLFDKEHLSSTLGEGEIYCSFFKNNEELVGSRPPHMTMGNLLYSKNKEVPEVNKWFNLSRNIVVVDAINNNIQHRLNGMDYDSDSMLLTNNEVIVNVTKENYERFSVPVMGFKPDPKELENIVPDKKENRIRNLVAIDNKIANNRVGEIVNFTQKLNSHLWNELNHNPNFDFDELYNRICILSILAGCEIDSSKRTFRFVTLSEIRRARQFADANGYDKKPVFFFYVSTGGKKKPKIEKIDKYLGDLSDDDFFLTSMDHLWKYARLQMGFRSLRNSKTIEFNKLICANIDSRGLSKENYNQIERARDALIQTRKILNDEKKARKEESYQIQRNNFNTEIELCYDKIKSGIANKKKTRVLINKYILNEATPHSLLFLLLYIISLKEKELGYGYGDLFENDGGVPALEQTSKKKAKFSLFDTYYYNRSAYHKIISAIRLIKEE